MSFLTCFWLLPQNEHFSRSPPSPMRATGRSFHWVLLNAVPVRTSTTLPTLLCSASTLPARADQRSYSTLVSGARHRLSAQSGQAVSGTVLGSREPSTTVLGTDQRRPDDVG